MNVKNILKEIEKVDPVVYDRLDTRRNTMKQFAGLAGKLALVTVPFALGSMFKKHTPVKTAWKLFLMS
ncbi:MAG: hypothetical protein WDO71_18845 [Bacteroidota bacterium]